MSGVVAPRIRPGSEREPGFDPRSIPDAVPPGPEPPSRYGNAEAYEVFGRTYRVLESSRGYDEVGEASWYGEDFHGRPTSSREPFDMYAMTAAHKSLPLPAYVEVENLDNGRKAVVRVNDRGPFHEGRIIDLSYAAALKLGVVGPGVARVRVRAVGPVQTRR
jgi:rare lipoprotein A